jgi:alkylation response protein AidB-like acyl-CoA dehydrogenase
MTYKAPVSELRFLFENVVDIERLTKTERFAEATKDLRDAILSEGAKLAEEVLAPLNRNGDLHPAYLENGVVRTSPGFADGYKAIADGGWIGIAADPEHGGMGLPQTLAVAMNEMMASACLSLQLNPLMSQGQIEALEHHASDALKAIYLPKLISGEWAGTMNLTEPAAGSDVGALRSKALANGDGTYAVSGQKIFISWGDNDFTENVCHLVLARLPDGVPGTKGISLFLVPKFLPDENGNPGKANSLKVVSLEHKLGLHGSPTAVMEYDGATGWLIGAEHAGMKAMFTMMNNARVGVAMQGLGSAEGAYQHALAFAQERKQGKTPLEGGTGSIIDHADVRRMLLTMKAQISAARAIIYDTAVSIDLATATKDADMAARAALLTPIAKAFGTDTGVEVAATALQVHGGMGFIEETGAAQYLRDVRVTTIYEGTNGIQAMDLVGRKLMDQGKAAFAMLAEISQTAALAEETLPDLAAFLGASEQALIATTSWMLEQDDINNRFAGAVPYLRAFALVLGGHYLLKAALAEGSQGPRTELARFFIRQMMIQTDALCSQAREGQRSLYAFTVEELAG